MASPALSDKTFARQYSSTDAGVASDTMSLDGTILKTGAMLLLLVAGGYFGWQAVESETVLVNGIPEASFKMPGWFFIALIGALILAFVTIFKPNASRITAPLYALLEGAVVGVISRFYSLQFDGVVPNAIIGTVAVFALMLGAYTSRTIRVTPKLRLTIIMATLGIMLVYLVSFVLSLFDVSFPFIWDSGPVGIAISVFICGIAAFNLLLDFDIIERGINGGYPKVYEWYGSFGLIVTLVWLYLEMLRLFAKIQGNR